MLLLDLAQGNLTRRNQATARNGRRLGNALMVLTVLGLKAILLRISLKLLKEKEKETERKEIVIVPPLLLLKMRLVVAHLQKKPIATALSLRRDVVSLPLAKQINLLAFGTCKKCTAGENCKYWHPPLCKKLRRAIAKLVTNASFCTRIRARTLLLT